MEPVEKLALCALVLVTVAIVISVGGTAVSDLLHMTATAIQFAR